jgi:hypothetical protein
MSRSGCCRWRCDERVGTPVTRPALSAAVATVAVVLAGCGSSSLSASRLRVRATVICNRAHVRTDAIATPGLPSQGERFLSRGAAALAPELTALRRLRAPDDLAGDYRRALEATAGELGALRFTVTGLEAGNDPVVAIKTLQQRLAPREQTGDAAWRALKIPACSAR